MILEAAFSDSHTTLDDLFRRAAVRHPDALALIDPPDRARVTDGEARTLTYAEADRAIWAVAARLRALGLATDAVVGLQLPNTVESVIALLGVLRAGMIAAPLPLLWRKSEIVAALNACGVKMLITSARIGADNHAEIAMGAAAGLFSIRNIGAFGGRVDGVAALDDVFAATAPIAPVGRPGNPGAHTAVITFDAAASGVIAVPRNHQHLIAAGLAVFIEGQLENDARLLAATPLCSLAGLGSVMLPWLLSGGTLVLHHPFDAEVFFAQRLAHDCTAMVVPGALAARLSERYGGKVLALWTSPERMVDAGKRHLDISVFGEAGLIASRPLADNDVAPLPRGQIDAPQGASAGIPVVETKRNAAGRLALRGPMVPMASFPPGRQRADAEDYLDTRYPCAYAEGGALRITGAPAGSVSVGGYRFSQGALDEFTARLSGQATLLPVPDALTGQRLAGGSPPSGDVSTKLAESGCNPLIIKAFRPSRATVL